MSEIHRDIERVQIYVNGEKITDYLNRTDDNVTVIIDEETGEEADFSDEYARRD